MKSRCAVAWSRSWGSSGQPEAITPLLLAVADESWPVRQAATELLAAFDEAALLPHLEAALRDDEDAAMRNAAMEIYVKMGAAASPALLALLGDADEEVRNFAAVMLGARRDRTAVPALIAALADPDVNVRHAAAASLGQIGRRGGGGAPHRGPAHASPGCSTRPSTPWARSATRARRAAAPGAARRRDAARRR